MRWDLAFVGFVWALLFFCVGFLVGHRYSVRVFVHQEADNTTRVVWLADWVRRRQLQLAITGGSPEAIAELARIDEAAFSDIPPDPFERFERPTSS